MNQTAQWLLFSRGRQNFALPAEALVCQLSAFATAVLPDAPLAIAGLFSFAGEALPMLDLAAAQGELADAAGNCLVVSIDGQQQLGLLSDQVAVLTDSLPEQQQINNADMQTTLLTTLSLKQLLVEVAL